MTEKNFILATAGHVDHGKSALVKSLTGTDPDRLPVEKARKITIELGFTQLILDGLNEQRLHVGIVDVPGHEDFVRNMIAGVGSCSGIPNSSVATSAPLPKSSTKGTRFFRASPATAAEEGDSTKPLMKKLLR